MKLNELLARIYIFILLILLPLDWFAPTGQLLREFGAKPAAPLLVFGTLFIFLFRPNILHGLSKPIYHIAVFLALIFLLGSAAFWINLIFSWSDFGHAKNPLVQFIAQGALFAAFAIVVIVHARFFENEKWRSFALSILPIIIVIHLAVFLLEATGIVSHAYGWLSLFRTEDATLIGRPSGLMSEPSYFGAFAAMYGFPLLVIRPAHRATIRWLLAGLLFISAILIRAKTFVPVIIFGCVILLWHRGRTAFRLKYILPVVALLFVPAFVIISNATFDLQENLSSVMRIGSTEMALNAADAGYGLTGVGFGQFHFFYRAEFAPSFLFSSQEAQDQMTGSITSRASTYNLYARLLIETGILGLICFLIAVYQSLQGVRCDYRPSTLFGLLLTAGSLGFLLTQDSYFYPPLAVGLAFLLGSASDSSTHIYNSVRNG